MNKSHNISNARSKTNDQIQFVPNLSTVEEDSLQMWMNALQSGKDVHCNLTTEDGYITITLVDDVEDCDKEMKRSGIPVKNDGEGLKKQVQDIDEYDCDSFSVSDSTINKDSTSKHTIIVTVASDLCDLHDESRSDLKCSIADPNIFPCIRNEWYMKSGREFCSNYNEINTKALAGDLRNFLRHYGISLSCFSKKYMDRSQGSVSDLLNHPKPWGSLKTRGRSLYIKMMEFLSSENLHSLVDELCVNKVRQGPPTAKLPDYFLEMLAKKLMPPTALMLKIAQENKLDIAYVKSYCLNQLGQTQDSVDVVVEFGDDGDASDDDFENIEETSVKSLEKVNLKSGFTPAFKDKQICPVLGCGCILSTKLTLKTHLLTHFGQKPFECKLCKKFFRTLSNLRNHESRHKKELKLSKRARNAAFLREKESAARKAASDIQMFVSRKKEIKKSNKQKLSTKKKEAKRLLHACGVCARSFSSARNLESHMACCPASSTIMHGQGRGVFVCQVCKQTSKATNDLFVDQEKHKEASLICKMCAKQIAGAHHCTRQNEIIRSSSKSFECSRCSAKFSDVHVLNAHMRIHTGKKPFTCETCGKQFAQRSTLLSHRLLHTNELPFLCATCGKGFRQKTNLRIHEQRHRAEKAYTCETCKQSFVTKLDLHRHSWKHKNRRFVCSKCSINYSRLNYLNEHVRKVHNILPYQCNSCGKGFSTKASFSKHQPCRSQMIGNKTLKETSAKIGEADKANSSSNLLVPVLPRAVCCISSSSTATEAELVKNPQLPNAMPNEVDPIFLPADSQSSFPLSAEADLPVAIVTDRGFVLASSKGVDSTLLDSNVSASNENLEFLTKISAPHPEFGESTENQSGFTLHSTTVSKH